MADAKTILDRLTQTVTANLTPKEVEKLPDELTRFDPKTQTKPDTTAKTGSQTKP